MRRPSAAAYALTVRQLATAMTSSLSLAWRLRPGAASQGGGAKTLRHHLDFIVDGRSLFELVHAEVRDLVGVLGWCLSPIDDLTVARLLLEQPSPYPAGRMTLFVCPECGDIGCGAITATVSLQNGRYTWRNFGYENNYDSSMSDFVTYAAVGPFEFEAGDYRTVLQSAGSLSL